MKIIREQQGGIVLEAALMLPFFLAFVVALTTVIHIAIVEMALQSAVSETTKVIASNMYPVVTLYKEAKSQYDQSRLAAGLNAAIDRVSTARSTVLDAEQFVEEYAAVIPEPVLELLKWEKAKREHGEGQAQEEIERYKREVLVPMVNAAFTEVVGQFADHKTLARDRLQVISVTLPSLEDPAAAYLGIEAKYEFPLTVPFFHRTLTLKKKSYERAWVGA